MDKLFTKIDKTVSQIASKVGARDAYAAASSRVVDVWKPGSPKGKNNLVPGYVVQLKHRKTTRSVQIVRRTSDNKLVVDALGNTGMQYFNANWVVQDATGPNTRIRLHNSYNFISFDPIHGAAVKHIQPHLNPPKETEWIIYDCYDDPMYVVLESVKFPCNYLSFDVDGLPMLCSDKQNIGANFLVIVQDISNSSFATEQDTHS
ncbi:hypothetical protein GJ496_002135 [Pomphorhynchus laevis]|nr:hypothetical protein GJ496_002135 [Pomphorhynchus laevis]